MMFLKSNSRKDTKVIGGDCIKHSKQISILDARDVSFKTSRALISRNSFFLYSKGIRKLENFWFNFLSSWNVWIPAYLWFRGSENQPNIVSVQNPFHNWTVFTIKVVLEHGFSFNSFKVCFLRLKYPYFK